MCSVGAVSDVVVAVSLANYAPCCAACYENILGIFLDETDQRYENEGGSQSSSIKQRAVLFVISDLIEFNYMLPFLDAFATLSLIRA